MQDTLQQDILQHFDEAIKFIDQVRSHTSVLVHCYAGISRSASVCVAYIMYKFCCRLEKALWYVKKKRDFIYPNPNFMRQLVLYEEKIFNSCTNP